MKCNKFGVEFEKAWLDIYYTLEDEAFDSTRVTYLDNGTLIADGVQYEEVPF